jgi:Bacterial regulatory proteins, gntR family
MFIGRGRRNRKGHLEGDSGAETRSPNAPHRSLKAEARFIEPTLSYPLTPMARITLHEQARRRIERLITDRDLKPGSQLPSETNLASELYVSRTTIRNALKFLEQEGKIERMPGRGSIVRQHRMG